MKKLFFLLLFSLPLLMVINAVKAYPYVIEMKNSDGTTLDVYLHGDESFRYMTTIDGYLIDFNNEGNLEYATYNNNGIVTMGIKANNPSFRNSTELSFINNYLKVSSDLNLLHSKFLQKNYDRKIKQKSLNGGFPLKGSPKSIVILVNFSNRKFNSPSARVDFTRMLNEFQYSDNGATGSAKDYFRTASYGQFEPNFVVVGPYDLPHDIAFYGEQEGDFVDKRPGNLIVDACKAADADVDFTEFDVNKDGYIDNVFVYYAGFNQAEGAGDNTIWPHRSTILADINFDGVKLYDYACTSELKGNSGNKMCAIGTFCHEFGHVLSLPDFYATNYSDHPTLGAWDIMDVGSYNNGSRTPPSYSAFERFLLGWIQPNQLSDGYYNLQPISTSNFAYIVSKDSNNIYPDNLDKKEFYLLENRNNTYDNDGVPANGMLITHIVYNKYDWDQNKVNNSVKRMGVEIHTASGNTSTPEQNIFPGSEKISKTDLYSRHGEFINSVSEITLKDNIISFLYGKPQNRPRIYLSRDKELFDLFMGEKEESVIRLKAENIHSDIIVSLRNGEHFGIKSKDNSEYSNKIEFKCPSDSILDIEFDVIFEPKRIDYYTTLKDNLVVRTDELELNFVLEGFSKRKVFVVPPTAYDAENVTPYSFTAKWNDVYDAKGYYLSLFYLENSDTIYVKNEEYISESFLDGTTEIDISDLLPNTEYYYRLRASDKDYEGRYENITDYSNIVKVITLDGVGKDSRELDIIKQGNNYIVYIPYVLPNYCLYIYSTAGRMIKKITVESNEILLPKLSYGNIYILKYSEENNMKRKSKVGKLFYNVAN